MFEPVFGLGLCTTAHLQVDLDENELFISLLWLLCVLLQHQFFFITMAANPETLPHTVIIQTAD